MTQTGNDRATETDRERIQRAADAYGWWCFGTGRAVRLERDGVTYSIVFNAHDGVSRASGPDGRMQVERYGRMRVSIPTQIIQRLAAPRPRRV